jgi:hypothetical protein
MNASVDEAGLIVVLVGRRGGAADRRDAPFSLVSANESSLPDSIALVIPAGENRPRMVCCRLNQSLKF